MTATTTLGSFVAQTGLIPRGTRVEVFSQIYWVFVILGTLVGVVVTIYTLYKAYKYRASAAPEEDDLDRPSVGEIPTGGGGGRKLFLSFALSTVVVISLIVWTYGTLLYVEEGPSAAQQEALEVTVEGEQFRWLFQYPNGHETSGELRVPADTTIRMTVTSNDVFHNFGIPELRVKSDAIPGETTSTWFVAEETGTYRAKCYELCGSGHSYMNAQVIVMEPGEFEDWYESTDGGDNSGS